MSTRKASIAAVVVLVSLSSVWLAWRSPSSAVAKRAKSLETEKVLYVMLDGLRLQESYKAAQFANTALRVPVDYTQRLTNELIPSGTLYTNAVTGAFGTTTTGCTNTLVTGAWGEGPNRGRGLDLDDEDFVDNRSFARTLFEKARDDLSLPQNKVAFISDKLNTRLSDRSYHPAGGDPLRPEFHFFTTRFNGTEPLGEETFVDPKDNSLVEVLDTAEIMMNSSEPDLMFLCMGLVDIAGHRAIREGQSDFQLYADSIVVWDELLTTFWFDVVQKHPAYAGKTTMILTADHGRHEDHDRRSFGEHQGTCDGCREIIMLVTGPDTAPGFVSSRRVYQADVAPTVARLMGLDLPESTGRVMYESIGLTSGLEHPAYISGLDAALDDTGAVHAAYRRAHSNGDSQLVYQRAPFGQGLESPKILESFSWRSPRFIDYPTITTEGSDVHIVAWQWEDEDRAQGLNHRYRYFESTDGGSTFTPAIEPLLTGFTEDAPQAGMVSLGQPEIEVINGTKHLFAPSIFYPTGGNMSALVRFSGTEFSPGNPKIVEDSINEVRRFGHHRDVSIMADSDGDLWATYALLRIPTNPDLEPYRATWEIEVKNTTKTSSSTPGQRLTDNNIYPYIQPSASIELAPPGLRGAGDRMHIVYAGSEADGFQLHYISSIDLDQGIWEAPVAITTGPARAWEPSIAFHDGLVHVAYTSFDPGEEGDIYYVQLLEGTPVTVPVNISSTAGVSRNPRLLLDDANSRLHIVWEERSSSGAFVVQMQSTSL